MAEDETGQVRVDAKQPRRSIYARVRRSQPVGMLQTFDAPVMSVNCDVRTVTTVAPQSLMMLNGDFVLEQASRVADRAIERASQATAPSDLDRRVVAANFATADVALRHGRGRRDGWRACAGSSRLPHYTGTSWQGGPTAPDSVFGWVILHASGGHPGNRQHPAIRRWIAPADGQLSITGTLQHGSENGDGVRGRSSFRRAVCGEPGRLRTNSTATEVASFAVQTGEAIDIVTDCSGT